MNQLNLLDSINPNSRICLLEDVYGEPSLTRGLQGTVSSIDDRNALWVSWDNGSNLAIFPGVDVFKLVDALSPGNAPQ